MPILQWGVQVMNNDSTDMLARRRAAHRPPILGKQYKKDHKAEHAGTGIPLMLCCGASRTDVQLNASFHGLWPCAHPQT